MYYVNFIVFFCKQKTAYEMRISDWSSDVCSSDLSDAHSRGCRARVLNRKGDRYTVMQSCVGAGAGAAKQVSQRQTVTVSDALTFTLQTRGPGTTYRYCPASMLRENLKGPTK